MPATTFSSQPLTSPSSSSADVMRYGCGRPRSFAPMRYNETFPPPCPVRLGAVAPPGVSRALQRRHSWANAQFQRAFDHDDSAAAAGLPIRPSRHSYPRHTTRHSSVDSTDSREDMRPSAAGPAVSPSSASARPVASPNRRSKLLRMGSSLDSSVRSSSAVIANKMRQVCDKLRQHAIQQSTHWPPPSAIFGERYMVADSHPFLAVGGRSLSAEKAQSAASTPARTRRTYPPRAGLGLRRRQSSESDSVYSSDAGDSSGIVCSELDLKAILSDYKGTGGPGPGGGGGMEKAGSSSGFFSLGCATPGVEEQHSSRTASDGRLAERSRSFTFASHKRRHFRKQVSFDDRDYYIYHSERKVSAIQEEIELAAMQATQGTASRCTSKLSIAEPSVEEASPEDDDRGDENRPLLSEAFAGGSESLEAPSDEVPSPPEITEVVEKPRVQQPKEVEFDEHGQTWDIYGAEFDPNILGQAIQKHLDTIIQKDIGDVFTDIDAEDDETRSSGERPGGGTERQRSTATCSSDQASSGAEDSTGLVSGSGGEAARSRITRLCAILFCVRSRRRPPRKAMR